ncbi:MAG: D-2-hydroxyacid dehydrogenase [Bacteroidales bacterium]
MKIVLLDASTLGNVSLDPIRALGDLTVYPLTTPSERIPRIRGMDVVITNKVIIDREVMDQCPELKLICVSATGMNNIDLIAAKEKGIQAKNVAAYSTDSVTQLTFAVLFHLMMNPPYFDNFVKSGQYSRGNIFTHLDLEFRQLGSHNMGIIGMGNIGKRVARVAEAFGARVLYYSTTGKNNQNPWPSVSLDDLLSSCDIVSIHAPLNDHTRNLLRFSRLSMMKPSAILLNMGRGGIVNEADLARALDEGIIRAAAVDVFEQEPLPANHPFLQMNHPERIILTPHIAWASMEAREALIRGIAHNIETSTGS